MSVKAECPGCGDEKGGADHLLRAAGGLAEGDWWCGVCGGTRAIKDWLVEAEPSTHIEDAGDHSSPAKPTMTKVSTIRTAIECLLRDGSRCIYLSHPVTTGGRSMAENVDLARSRAESIRALGLGVPVLNPTIIDHIEGWDHAKWMELWLPFISERVCTLVMAPDWERSKGCGLEREAALVACVQVVSFDEFVEEAKSVRDRIVVEGLDVLGEGK